MILSAAMMLGWLARQHDAPAWAEAAARVELAVCRDFEDKATWP
jgi:hypothetical protein